MGGTTRLVPKRIAEFRAGNGMDGVADRIQKWNDCSAPDNLTVNSLKNVLVTSYTADANDVAGGCPDGDTWGGQEGEALKVFPKVEMREAELLAECMDSKVGDVFLKSHIQAMAADCVATVMPALSPDRAKQLGTYWQTPEQLTALLPALASETNEE